MRGTWMARLLRRAVTLLRGGRADREVAEEMELHVELETEELVRSGMRREEARQEALRRFGGVDRHREAVREARGVAWIQDAWQDLRQALRTMARQPGFTAAALVTLALGIGASTAIFSVVDAVLLRPLPYPDPDGLVRVHPAWDGAPDAQLSPAEFLDVRELDVFERLGAYAFGTRNVTGDGGEPERLAAAFLSAGVIQTLGVSPALGRAFTTADDEGGARVALLSHGLWTRRFGGRPDVVGRTMELNGATWEIIGVLGDGFVLPEDLGRPGGRDVYLPLGISPAADLPRGSHFLYGVARAREGVAPASLEAAVARAGREMVRLYPDDYPVEMEFGVVAPSLHDEVLGRARPVLGLLVGAVAFLLLIACANVANLLLAGAEGREREFTLRRALGAGSRRLLRQLLVESLTLGFAGAALGTGVAWLATRMLVGLQPPDVPRLADVSLDPATLLFTVGLALTTGMAFGLVPALRTSRRGDAMPSGVRTTGVSGGGRLRRALVATQLSAAVVLLTGAVLLGRTLVGLMQSDPGYRTEGVLTAEVSLPATRYPSDEEVTGFYDRLTRRLEAVPGVVDAGAVSSLPLASPLGDLNFRIEGRPVAEGDVSPRADWQAVTAGYLRAMDIGLLQGRLFDERDGADAPGAVLISRTTAERYWPGASPLGERFTLGGGAGPGVVTVVGVVEDVAHAELGAPAAAQMWIPHAQFRFWGSGVPVRAMDVVIRTQGAPASLARALRAEVAALDPSLPVASIRTMDEVVAASVAQPRLLASLLGAFALVAVVLAGVGVYGVTAYRVGRRTREFGIRMALGAQGGSVLGMVVREELSTIGVGVALGTAAAWALAGGLQDMLYGVRATDPLTLGSVALLLGGFAVVAALVPARRATRVDPALPLREG